MSNKTPSFTQADVGQPVVFKGFDGGSYSSTVMEVKPDAVRVQYFPHPPIKNLAGGVTVQPVYATIMRADWHRLTKFPQQSKFFVLAS